MEAFDVDGLRLLMRSVSIAHSEGFLRDSDYECVYAKLVELLLEAELGG